VIDTQAAQWVGHIGQENDLAVALINPNSQAAIAVPILHTSRVIGVLEVQSLYRNVFGAATADKLSGIVEQLADPLEDAWLLDNGWLLRHTREALRHLWDEVYLGKCALTAWLFASNSRAETLPAARGLELQQMLLDAIEQVGAKEGGDHSRTKRRYQILHQTYVEGLAVEVITEKLSVSRRQYFYNLKEALEEVVHFILN
jgi:hypothetical protein